MSGCFHCLLGVSSSRFHPVATAVSARLIRDAVKGGVFDLYWDLLSTAKAPQFGLRSLLAQYVSKQDPCLQDFLLEQIGRRFQKAVQPNVFDRYLVGSSPGRDEEYLLARLLKLKDVEVCNPELMQQDLHHVEGTYYGISRLLANALRYRGVMAPSVRIVDPSLHIASGPYLYNILPIWTQDGQMVAAPGQLWLNEGRSYKHIQGPSANQRCKFKCFDDTPPVKFDIQEEDTHLDHYLIRKLRVLEVIFERGNHLSSWSSLDRLVDAELVTDETAARVEGHLGHL